jgi:hypothetical protein
MKRSALSALLLCTFAAFAQDHGNWRALSKTARSITGDVTLSNDHISIDFTSFTIAQIRPLRPQEAASAFTDEAAPGGAGNLYRLSVPGNKKCVGKNTLCGAEDTQWMVTYVAGKTLQLAFFSGETMPVLTPEAMTTATDVCGTYTYTR